MFGSKGLSTVERHLYYSVQFSEGPLSEDSLYVRLQDHTNTQAYVHKRYSAIKSEMAMDTQSDKLHYNFF